MKLSIDIPTSLKDVTLKQYKHFLKMQDKNKDDKFVQAKMIEIFCNVRLDQVLKLRFNDTQEIVKILSGLFEEKPPLVHKFKINKKEYGFHPELDDLSLGEYIDLDTYIGDWDNIEKAMNVLYRPITHKLKDNYNIEEYKAEDNPDLLNMPMDAVLSSIFFLWNLGIDLSKTMTNYLDNQQTEALTEYLSLQENGDGINHFIHSLEGILQDLKVSLN
jgi:hypothetical protein|tara:strand:+ start:2730 stop:3380 length:651 start_codon:yes stop_codon:yes gene_type:complete